MLAYRRDGGRATPGIIDFHRLSPATRERFVRATLGQEPTGVLLAARKPALGTVGGWVLLMALGLSATVGAAMSGFGELGAGHPPADSALYVLGGFLALFGGAMAARSAWLRGTLPFLPGVYVFAQDLVDARSSQLRVTPLEGLVAIRGPYGGPRRQMLTLHFDDDATYELPSGGWEPGELRAELSALRRAAERAADRDDMPSLSWLDPFFSDRERWGAVPASGRAPRASWSRLDHLVAPVIAAACLALAAPLGLVLRWTRDVVSDAAGVREAAAANLDTPLEAYARSGGPAASLADDERLGMAIGRRSMIALEVYLLTGGRHVRAADDALFALAAQSGSKASLRRYLENGVAHRQEALALLAE